MAAPTENSHGWTTGGAGDGADTEATTDWDDIFKIIAACHGEEGVGDWLNHYDATGSTGGEVVTIDTGCAIVDGRPHICSVGGDLDIVAAVGGGNTRIDRVVLRASWAAQTVRLTVIGGTDAASPTAPAVTTTSGTTYDILLYQVTVNVAGDVSISTDERDWSWIRARKAHIPAKGATLEVDIRGVQLSPTVDAYAYGSWRVPEDFVSTLKIYAVVVATATGDVRITNTVNYGADTEDYNTHSDEAAASTRSVTAAKVEEFKLLTLSDAAVGDTVFLRFYRDADHGDDTNAGVLSVTGWVAEYNATGS